MIAGARQTPGAAILSATAALRAGAGTLQIATVESVATAVGAAVPEALVLHLPETGSGAIALAAARRLKKALAEADAILFGPGMLEEKATGALLSRLLESVQKAVLVLDAAALKAAASREGSISRWRGRVILTPHDGEMAKLLRVPEGKITGQRAAFAVEAARRFRAVVALKGMATLIASPDGPLLVNRMSNPGLATSGSGDTLSGIAAGLAARGASPFAAAAWAVFVHARAGDRLVRRFAPLGFLARELLEEIPRALPAG